MKFRQNKKRIDPRYHLNENEQADPTNPLSRLQRFIKRKTDPMPANIRRDIEADTETKRQERAIAEPAIAAHRAAGGPVTVHAPSREEYFQPEQPTTIRPRKLSPDPWWDVTDAEWEAKQSLPDEHVREAVIKRAIDEVLQGYHLLDETLAEELPKFKLGDDESAPSATPQIPGGSGIGSEDDYELGLSKDLPRLHGLTPVVRGGVSGKFGEKPDLNVGAGIKGRGWEAGGKLNLSDVGTTATGTPRKLVWQGDPSLYFKKGRLAGEIGRKRKHGGVEGGLSYDLGKYGKLGAKGGLQAGGGHGYGGLQWTGRFEEGQGISESELRQLIDEALKEAGIV